MTIMNAYAIDPADQHIADEIRNSDLVYDSPGPVTVTGHIRLPSEIPLTTFAPDVANRIRSEAAQVPEAQRAEVEQRLAAQVLYRKSEATRIQAGAGERADAWTREKFSIANDIYNLERERDRLSAELVEVARHDTVTDPKTGKVSAVPIERYQGPARDQRQMRFNYLTKRIELLQGSEGDRRMEQALYQAVQDRKKLAAMTADNAEAKRRAEAMAREARTNKQAEGIARRLSNQL